MQAISFPVVSKHTDFDRRPAAHKIRSVLLWLLEGILVVVLALPVLLLFIGTAVPWYLSTALLLVDVALIVLFVRSRRTLRYTVAAILAFLIVAVVAVTVSQLFASTPSIIDAG